MAHFNGTWKHIATSTTSIILTFVVAWFAFGGGVTSAEARQTMEDHAATIHDKSVPRKEFEMVLYELRELNKKVDKIIEGRP